MKYLERIFFYVFPSVLVKGTRWYELWQEKERSDFLLSAKVFLPLAALAYIAHYYLIDRSEGLAPSDLWMSYRFSMAAAAIGVWLIYLSQVTTQSRFYKVPLLLVCLMFCFFQARSIQWYAKIPYLYAFFFNVGAVQLARMSLIPSLAYSVLIVMVQWQSLVASGIAGHMIASATSVTLITVVFIRSRQRSDVQYFLANQEKLEYQKQIVQINIDFNSQIQSFLPREISRRLNFYINKRRMSVFQAINEVLRPRKLQVACLFSDIRGFTRASQDLEGFVRQGVMPNVAECAAAVENHSGIPRKIGDLLFAYFDGVDPKTNVARALLSAVRIVSINREFNTSHVEQAHIRRHVLLSVGEAIVGNLGGLDSSIEITALGPPVNFLSRLDELTKVKKFKSIVADDDIIVSDDCARIIEDWNIGLEMKKIDLHSAGLKIRNFPNSQFVWLIPASKENMSRLSSLISKDEEGRHRESA